MCESPFQHNYVTLVKDHLKVRTTIILRANGIWDGNSKNKLDTEDALPLHLYGNDPQRFACNERIYAHENLTKSNTTTNHFLCTPTSGANAIRSA
jgi:hypothetical protein